jgi:hypothetical protein
VTVRATPAAPDTPGHTGHTGHNTAGNTGRAQLRRRRVEADGQRAHQASGRVGEAAGGARGDLPGQAAGQGVEGRGDRLVEMPPCLDVGHVHDPGRVGLAHPQPMRGVVGQPAPGLINARAAAPNDTMLARATNTSTRSPGR